eukprot:CAMPEP_0203830390 /NCGR_PEP_ID=MMETSP0115-20131106/65885_1 /ASSEMBLY_ACC=CAM_ASM_000227 /TAXON_ID=33651 /ORGANISM="Bicosoecid sp, Strain ms1" /LENGTH=139 /DNA_ID=CAMNT_0050739453 /DNA_START=281 /DNA_END=703 /DNA_ORIENTATION=+
MGAEESTAATGGGEDAAVPSSQSASSSGRGADGPGPRASVDGGSSTAAREATVRPSSPYRRAAEGRQARRRDCRWRARQDQVLRGVRGRAPGVQQAGVRHSLTSVALDAPALAAAVVAYGETGVAPEDWTAERVGAASR